MSALSIIVTVYNEEATIRRSIQTIQNQHFEDIEIIIIDDGSNDCTPIILQEIADNDQRIKVYRYPNGGLGFARRKGLGLASGKYVGFADADDWIEPEMFGAMIESLETDDADVVVCAIMKDHKPSQVSATFSARHSRFENLLKDFICFKFDFSVCNKIYRRAIIEKYSITFDKNLRISQDVLFNLKVFSTIKRVSLRPEPFYHYLSKPGSLMTRPQSQRIESFNYIIDAFRDFCTKHGLDNEWVIFADNIGTGYQQYFLGMMLNSAETQPMRFSKYYKHVLMNLRLMNPLLLETIQPLKGYQKLRMGLLKKRMFRTFALLSAIRHKTIFV